MKYLINDKVVSLATFKRRLKKAIEEDSVEEENFHEWLDERYLPGGLDIGPFHYSVFDILYNDPGCEDRENYWTIFKIYISVASTAYIREMENGDELEFSGDYFRIINEN